MASKVMLVLGDGFVQCPYNESHTITSLQYQTHVTKCRQNYMKSFEAKCLKPPMAICRYNASHYIPQLEINLHEKNCSDRFTVLQSLARSNVPGPVNVPMKPISPKQANLSEKDWDRDFDQNAPGDSSETKSKSERKQFRREMLDKMSQFLQRLPIDFPVRETSDAGLSIAKEMEELKLISESHGHSSEKGGHGQEAAQCDKTLKEEGRTPKYSNDSDYFEGTDPFVAEN